MTAEMAQQFNGLGMHLGNLWRVSDARSRSISVENITGEKAGGARATDGLGAKAARDLGPGWKMSPALRMNAGTTTGLADIEGPGAIQQIWLAIDPKASWRFIILRIFWDDEATPAVECPIGDFFASGWQEYGQISSLAVCSNPTIGLACYWEMPFRRRARISVENLGPESPAICYQINYTLTEVPDDAAYFHAQFRRTNPVAYKDVYTVVDGIRGRGQYVGTYLAWGSNSGGWWGEGEMHFFLDGDDYPTIAGTGVEDYFCGAYGFRVGRDGKEYCSYTTPYTGFQVFAPDPADHDRSQMRFGMYRWHVTDPVRFTSDLRITVQALGWRKDGRYLPLQDDLASVAYWYQTLPAAEFPALPERDQLEII